MNLESLFLYAAVGGGVVLLTQLVMMVFGGDDGGFDDGSSVSHSVIDHSAVDHSGNNHHNNNGGVTDASGFWFFEMISLRTLAAAATFFGLVGGGANATGAPAGVSLALAALAGYGAMYAVYWAFKQIFRLETQGNEDEIEIDADGIDIVTYADERIDIGEAVAETLALAVNPFPRAPHADTVLRAAGVLSEDQAGPFAALAALKSKAE